MKGGWLVEGGEGAQFPTATGTGGGGLHQQVDEAVGHDGEVDVTRVPCTHTAKAHGEAVKQRASQAMWVI